MRRLLVGAAVIAALVSTAAPTWAESSGVREARRHMEDGQEFFLQERWADAAGSFMTAFELRPHMAFLFNAALAYHRLGDAEHALELYRRYLEGAPTSRDRPQVEESIRLLERSVASAPTEPCVGEGCPPTGEDRPPCAEDDVECQLARQPDEGSADVRIVLDPEAAAAARATAMKSVVFVEVEPAEAVIALVDETGRELIRGQSPLEYTADAGRYTLLFEHPEYRPIRTPIQINAGRYYVFYIEMSQPPAFLQVVSNVPGATVYLDDRSHGPVGTTPWGNVVSTGAHRLWIERPGYQTIEQEFEIGLGQEQEVRVDLERLEFGMLRVLANVEEATVEIDGEAVGTAPVEHQLSPGEHQLRLRSRGMKDYETAFTIERGQTTRTLVRMNPRPSRTSAWVSLAFSALSFAAAGVVGYLSTQVYDELEADARRGQLATDDERIDRGFIMAIGADVGFGLGTIVAGLTLYYFLRDPLPDSEGRVEDPVDFTENPTVPGQTPPSTQAAPVVSVRPAAAQTPPPPRASAPPLETPVETTPAPAETSPAPAEEGAPEAPPNIQIVPVQPPAAGGEASPEASSWPRRRRGPSELRQPRVQLGVGPGLVLRF